MTNSTPQPYEMHAHGGGGFTVFDSGEAVALPLLHLSKATLRGAGGQRMGLEYASAMVVVEGDGLAELFAHLLAGRVKTIRAGRHQDCTISQVQVVDA